VNADSISISLLCINKLTNEHYRRVSACDFKDLNIEVTRPKPITIWFVLD